MKDKPKKAEDPPKKRTAQKGEGTMKSVSETEKKMHRANFDQERMKRKVDLYTQNLNESMREKQVDINVKLRGKSLGQLMDEKQPRPKMEYMGKNKPSYLGTEKPRPSPLKPLGPVGRGSGGGPKKSAKPSAPKKASNYMGATMTPGPKAYVKKIASAPMPNGKKGKMK